MTAVLFFPMVGFLGVFLVVVARAFFLGLFLGGRSRDSYLSDVGYS